MKKLTLLLVLLLSTNQSFAYFYIVNIDNKVVARTNYKPSQKDLDTREEIAIESKELISLHKAEYRNGKIVIHKETQQEKKDRNKKENAKIKRKTDRESAKTKLLGLGLTQDEVNAIID